MTKNKTMTVASLAVLTIAVSLTTPAFADFIGIDGDFNSIIHSGEDIDKIITVPDAAFDGVITEPLTVTATSLCGNDNIGNPIITITPAQYTEVSFDDMVSFNEKVTAMPGNYWCFVEFEVADVNLNSHTDVQENHFDVIGSTGYWKNHPDATLWVLDIKGSITIGTEVFTDAELADVQDILKKKGGNTVDKFAAQAAAAQLNSLAVMKVACPDVIAALNAGNALIDSLGYDGTPKSVKNVDSKGDKSTINGYKDTLDEFNNDNTCFVV
jgi:hypothetical protein